MRLAAAGYTVYGTSRRGAKSGRRSFSMRSLDVRGDDSVEAAIGDVLRSDGRIDVLVDNAGFSVAPAGAEESSIEQAGSIFETNFFGIVRMTRAVVAHTRRAGRGRIINIGSVLGFLPMPYGALHAASKPAIEGYSESLDHELRTRGIRVSVLNSLGGDTLARSLRILKPGGQLISISGPPDPQFARDQGLSWTLRQVVRVLSYRIRSQAKRRQVRYAFLFMRANGDQLRTSLLSSIPGSSDPWWIGCFRSTRPTRPLRTSRRDAPKAKSSSR